jgi:uncharacterized membrane protein
MTRTKRTALVLLGVIMIAVGLDHFLNPTPFERIVPRWLPSPAVLVAVSGFFEVLGGVGLLVPRTRRFAAWGLVALYVAVFPANVNMAVHQIQLAPTDTFPVWAMWARLPFQAVFIAWAYWLTRDDGAQAGASALTNRA